MSYGRIRFLSSSFGLAMALTTTAWSSFAEDKPATDASSRDVGVDSTKVGTVLEKMTEGEDDWRFDILPVERSHWTPICVTPCRVSLDLNTVYRVHEANGVSQSNAFTLLPQTSNIHISARPAWLHDSAAAFIATGVAVAVSSAVAALAATDRTAQRDAWIVAGAAAGSLVVTIPLRIFTTTDVSVE